MDLVWQSVKYFSIALIAWNGCSVCFFQKTGSILILRSLNQLLMKHYKTERTGDFFFYSLYSNQLGVVINPQRLEHLSDIMTE